MKKKNALSVFALLISVLTCITFVSCDKDTMCYVNVTVIDEIDNSPVEGAYLKIDNNGSSIFAEGTTNANGVFKTEFAAPAIFNVNVKKDVNFDSITGRYRGYRAGDATFKLKTAETKEVTVKMKKEVIPY